MIYFKMQLRLVVKNVTFQSQVRNPTHNPANLVWCRHAVQIELQQQQQQQQQQQLVYLHHICKLQLIKRKYIGIYNIYIYI